MMEASAPLVHAPLILKPLKSRISHTCIWGVRKTRERSSFPTFLNMHLLNPPHTSSIPPRGYPHPQP